MRIAGVQRDTAETRFHQTLSAYLQQSNSWACRFPRTTRAGIIIHTAPNGHLRSFSWDAQSGGTLREYHNLRQSRTPSGRSATQKGEGILIVPEGDERKTTETGIQTMTASAVMKSNL